MRRRKKSFAVPLLVVESTCHDGKYRDIVEKDKRGKDEDVVLSSHKAQVPSDCIAFA